MNVIQKLKGETLRRMLVLILLLAILGAACIAASNLFAEEPVPQNLYDVPRSQLEGSYVTVEVKWIYGCYAYTEEYRNNNPTGKITQREYVIDANEDDYCALILDGSLMDKAETLLAECDAYYYGETDTVSSTFTVTGRVRSLPSDSLELYHEIFDYDNLSVDEQAIVLPLYISPSDYSVQGVPLVIGIVLLGIAILLLVLSMTGWFQRQIKEKLATAANTEEQLMHMYYEVPAEAGVRIDKGSMLLRAGFSHYLYDSNDLVWAYQQVTRQKLYGIITVGKSTSLMLKLANGKSTSVSMRAPKVKAMLEKIAVCFPSCALGYSDQLAQLYHKDPNALRQVAAAQRENQ